MASRILLVYAHPYPDRSLANRVLLGHARKVANVEVRSLYDVYPDFAIDVEAERAALSQADVVVWQHPMYWYTVPALLKLWFEKVLGRGWAYGEGGTALRGKTALWVVTTGGDEDAFTPEGMHGHPFAAFAPVVEQTARFCGMHWEYPIVLHGAHKVARDVIEAAAQQYRTRLEGYGARTERR